MSKFEQAKAQEYLKSTWGQTEDATWIHARLMDAKLRARRWHHRGHSFTTKSICDSVTIDAHIRELISGKSKRKPKLEKIVRDRVVQVTQSMLRRNRFASPDREHYDDIVAETQIAVFTGLDTYGYNGFYTWVYRIGKHKAIDADRKIKRSIIISDDERATNRMEGIRAAVNEEFSVEKISEFHLESPVYTAPVGDNALSAKELLNFINQVVTVNVDLEVAAIAQGEVEVQCDGLSGRQVAIDILVSMALRGLEWSVPDFMNKDLNTLNQLLNVPSTLVGEWRPPLEQACYRANVRGIKYLKALSAWHNESRFSPSLYASLERRAEGLQVAFENYLHSLGVLARKQSEEITQVIGGIRGRDEVTKYEIPEGYQDLFDEWCTATHLSFNQGSEKRPHLKLYMRNAWILSKCLAVSRETSYTDSHVIS